MSVTDGISFWFGLVIVKFLIFLGIVGLLLSGLIVLIILEYFEARKRKKRRL